MIMVFDVFEFVYCASMATAFVLLLDVLDRFHMFGKFFIEFALLVIFVVVAAVTVYNLGVTI